MSEYYADDGRPLKCVHCESDKQYTRTIDMMDYLICEYEVCCENCNRVIGYWAYGYYDPEYTYQKNNLPEELFHV